MRTTERLTKLKGWVYHELCAGRSMKAPSEDMNVTKFIYREPSVYLAYAPLRADETGFVDPTPYGTVPSITILPGTGYAKNQEEKRFDRYNHIFRTQQMGQQLPVTLVFAVYEDGVRMPGFIDKYEETGEIDMTLIQEGTEEGFFRLLNWMDDFIEKALGAKTIPGTDLSLVESSMIYGMRSDQKYIADKRPLYFGLVEAIFQCHANEKPNTSINNLLR